MKFLASVGVGQLFRVEDGEPKLFATARTLTETTLSFSSQSIEVTEGAGEQLADTFTGQSRLKIDLTEVNFDFKYLSALLNPASVPDPKVFFSERLTVGDNQTVNISKVPAVLGNQFGLDKYLIFYKKYGAPEIEWQSFVIDRVTAQGKTLTLPDSTLVGGDEVCVKYFTSAPQAQSVLIGANFMPQELMLVLTTKLISSPTGRIEDGEVEGEIVLRIPRYKLDANFNLQMAMSSFSSVPISGTALAYQDASDPFSLNYGDIVESVKSEDSLKTGLVSIYVDAESGMCFGLYKDGHTALLPISNEVPNGLLNDCPTLISVELPDTIESIADEAFAGDSNLDTITLFSTSAPQLQTASAIPQNCTIYVLSGSVGAYRAAENWSTLSDRIFAIPTSMLAPPILSISGNYLTISSGNPSVDYYTIYVNGVVKQEWKEVAPSEGTTIVENFNLSELSDTEGIYSITAVSVKAGFVNSLPSNAANYCVYSLSKNTGAYGTINGWPLSETIVAGTSINLQIVKRAGGYCDFPSAITVVNADGQQSYDSTTGSFTISNPTGPVSIIAQCVPWVFNINVTTSNCSVLASSDTTIVAYETAEIIIEADTANYYELPSSISVQNVSIDSYNSSTGIITIKNPIGNKGSSVGVTVTAVPMTFSLITSVSNGQVETSGGQQAPSSIQAHESYSLKIVPNSASYMFPQSIQATGATISDYNLNDGTFTIVNPTQNITITASCPGALAFQSNGDGTCSVSQGSWNGDHLIIPSVSPSGDQVVEISSFVGSDVETVIIPSGVTSIDTNAFSYCSQLTGLSVEEGSSTYYSQGNCIVETSTGTVIQGCNASVIPSSSTVTIIGDNAFEGRSSLENITIPSTITTIGDNAFAECSSLQGVSIPGSVVNIGENAFSGCELLSTLSVGNGVQTIGVLAFQNCFSLEEVALPNSVTHVGELAFLQCEGLISVTLSNQMTTLEPETFEGCVALQQVNFSTALVDIGDAAFADCSSLLAITIPDTVLSIGNSAFSGCVSLSTVTIPSGVQTIGTYAFYDCPIETATIPTTAISSIPKGVLKAVTVASGTTIPNEAFSGCISLQSITIGNSVTTVGSNAFNGCSALDGVYITSIASWCGVSFGNATANPLYYTSNLYSNNQLVTALSIPDGVTSVGAYAFYGCALLVDIEIPYSTTSIGDFAFYGCSSLSAITYDGYWSQMSKGSNWDTGAGAYTLVSWSEGLAFISNGDNTCYVSGIGSNSDSTLRLPKRSLSGESVTSVGDAAFLDNSTFTSVIFPNTITSVGDHSFAQCRLTSVVVGGNIKTINDSAFGGCSYLVSVEIQNSVETIGDYAFVSCGRLGTVTIGSGIISIGDEAFDRMGVDGATVTITKPIPPQVGVDAFGIEYGTYYIYVPSGSVGAYQSAADWSDYASHIQAIPS